jgi:hypothetical protein
MTNHSICIQRSNQIEKLANRLTVNGGEMQQKQAIVP